MGTVHSVVHRLFVHHLRAITSIAFAVLFVCAGAAEAGTITAFGGASGPGLGSMSQQPGHTEPQQRQLLRSVPELGRGQPEGI